MLSSMVTCNSHVQDSPYFAGWEEYEKNPYHPRRNPAGIIQLGLAENQLPADLLESWIARNPETVCFPARLFRKIALFQDYHGLPEFKDGLAYYMSEIRQNRVQFEPSNIVLTAGATCANEILMFCLTERGRGDAFLIPTPYYPGFDRDLRWRTEVEIVPIHCTSENGFRITESALENAYESGRNLDLNVQGVFLTNPSNPLGTTLSRDELNLVISFTTNKGGLHIVSDEIYAGTVYDSPRYISMLEAIARVDPDPNSPIWDRVHIVSSLSKDLGLPGFRMGSIYSYNKKVVETATKMSSFGLISSQSQFLLAKVLSDKKFVKKYIAENRRRLKKRRNALVSALKRFGVSCLAGNAGLFCWVDLRRILRSKTFEAEMEVWKKMVFDSGLNMSPGSSCHCSEPGWFRVCFANVEDEGLRVAVERIRVLVHQETFKSVIVE